MKDWKGRRRTGKKEEDMGKERRDWEGRMIRKEEEGLEKKRENWEGRGLGRKRKDWKGRRKTRKEEIKVDSNRRDETLRIKREYMRQTEAVVINKS